MAITKKATVRKKATRKRVVGKPRAARLRVRSKVEGFRRAGRAWGREAVEVIRSDFTVQQIKALRSEQMLVVEDIE